MFRVSARTHVAVSVKTRSATIPPDMAKIKEYLCFIVYTENPRMLTAAERPTRRADVRCIKEGNGLRPATIRETPAHVMHLSPRLGNRGEVHILLAARAANRMKPPGAANPR